ncbi:MAG: TonB-dependent receptor domain-containing protein, partial [Pyrinomonadaceae bacterium]
PTVATVVDRQFVENLPLNGRSFNALISLTPGVVLTPTSTTEQGQFSVNGQRADANYFTIDGTSANVGINVSGSTGQSANGSIPASGALGGTNNLVSIDALQEFRIQTSTFAPEFGRTPGAQVQIVTRSGTNDFHGNLFDYFRNDLFDANDWFSNANSLAKPTLRQNDYGGVVGGPLYLPRFGEGGPYFSNGRDRTFFFFSYEGLRLRQPRVGITTVPSLCLRGEGPCPTGQTPAAASIRPFLNAFPLPNGPVSPTNPGLAAFNTSFSNPSNLDATGIRIDHSMTPNLTVFGRYNHGPSDTDVRGGTPGTSLSKVSSRQFGTDTLTLGSTWVISATSSNEIRFNYSRTSANNFETLDNFGEAVVPPDSLFFPSPFTREDGFISLNFFGGGATYNLGLTVDNLQRQINVVDNYSIVHGAHSFKFGFDYRRLSPFAGPRAYSQTSTFSSLPVIVAGNVSGGNILANEHVELFFTNFSAYGQDTWKIGRRLTLTYGLRWDVNPPPSAPEGRELFAVTGYDDFSTLALSPRGTPLWKTTYNNVAPRIGAAYQLSQKPGLETVLRGGVGMFYDTGTSSVGTATAITSFPFATQKNIPGGSAYPLSPALAAPPAINSTSPGQAGTTFVSFDPELKLPRVYQWNFAIEQSLGAKRTFSASYVAAVGRRLLRRRNDTDLSLAIPGSIVLNDNGDTSDYHGLQLQFQQRLSSGLQALASYSWSHSIDVGSSDFGARNARQVSLNSSRGSSDFDIRHSFNTALTYNIPTLRFVDFGKTFFGGWSVDSIFSARSALPVDVSSQSFQPTLGFQSIRPNLNPGVPLYIEDSTFAGGRRINPAAFTAQPLTVLQHGTLGRNSLRGFSFWQLDFALRRELKLTEGVKLQLRSDFFNIFNHPNFGDPVSNLANAQFGQSIQLLGRSLGAGGGDGGFNPLFQVGGPRSLQFALKLLF